MLAARWGGYNLREYKALSGTEKAEIIAAYRDFKQFEAVQAALQAREHKKKQSKK